MDSDILKASEELSRHAWLTRFRTATNQNRYNELSPQSAREIAYHVDHFISKVIGTAESLGHGMVISPAETAMNAVSDMNWTVGRCANESRKSNLPMADFACIVGLRLNRVEQLRTVYAKFHDVKSMYPNLVWMHFYAALEWDDADECLKWANDVKAYPAEMRAWRRAQRGENLIVEPMEGMSE